MTITHANVLVTCAMCDHAVEWLLGLPVVDDGERLIVQQLRVAGDAMDAHLQKSPECMVDGRIAVHGTPATPETYGAIKPTLPGVPRLMAYPRD